MTGGENHGQEGLRCIEVVSLLSAYLDGEVSQDQHARIADHLKGCDGCRAALGQFQTVIHLTGRLTLEDVANIGPLIRDRLAATLRIPRRR
jgi:predicted anti-sigma-YlaC factor YlaD